MAQNTLKDDCDKELAILGAQKQVPYVVATQVAMNAEALVKEQVNEIFAIGQQDGTLEDVVLYLDLGVVVPLKDLRQGESLAVPVNGQSEIALELRFALFTRLLRLGCSQKRQARVEVFRFICRFLLDLS